MLLAQCVDLVSQVYAYLQTHQGVYLKSTAVFCFICITKALKIRRQDAQGLAAGPRWMYPLVAPFRDIFWLLLFLCLWPVM